jgi:protein O-mannosyl-transferase
MFQSLWTKRDIIICIALSIVIIIIYWRVKEFKFIYYDDNAYVTERTHVMSGLTWTGIKWAVSSMEAGFWHPLTWFSLMVDRELFNYQAGGFHWTNVILHILNTLLLFALFREATEAPLRSAFVALLFAIHPLHVESVAWVSQRKDLLCTLFGFASLWAYVIYAKAPGWRKYSLVVIIFILGLMSKPMIVTFPFVMLLMDFWPLQRLASLKPKSIEDLPPVNHPAVKRSILFLLLEKLPLIALSFLASILVIFTERKVGALTSLEDLTIMERCANAVVSYIKYIVMTFWPAKLAFYYPYPAAIPLGQIIGAVAIVITVTTIVIAAHRRRPYLFVGWFWYLGTLLPVIGLIQVGPHALADRYSYVTTIGLFIMIVWGMVDLTAPWQHKRIFLWVIGLATVIGLSWCAWLQAGYWRNSITLFNHALKVTTGNYIALNNLGYIYMNSGEIDKGINYIKESIRVKPKYGLSHHNVGVGLYVQGHYEKAIEYLKKAQALSFRSDETPRYLGDAYRQTGRGNEAIEAYESALAMNSGNLLARYGLALALSEAGRNDEAIRELKEVLSYDPKKLDVWRKLMMILIESQSFDAALTAGERALSIDPANPEILNMMDIAKRKKRCSGL